MGLFVASNSLGGVSGRLVTSGLVDLLTWRWAVAGLAAFAELLVAGGTTPFVVADSIGIGGLVFLLARVLLVSLHELAHGLTLASVGRRVERAGLKLLLIFPFAFADTSESWFESRRRRLAVTAAGPVSDLALGGAFAVGARLAPVGTARDILFQLAFAAYVGAFYNLNPLLDRDGYHLLVDLVREPGLRRRSREYVARRLAGAGGEAVASTRTVAIYGVSLLVWAFVAIGFVALITVRYYDRLVAIAPREVVWTFLVALYIVMFVPVLVMIGRPLAERRRRSLAGANGVGA
jgi:putative peptide zinc metalloprotease protein